jgi:hypothetical protein
MGVMPAAECVLLGASEFHSREDRRAVTINGIESKSGVGLKG